MTYEKLFDNRNEVVIYSAKGEPGEHMDNVSGAGPNMQLLYNRDEYPKGIRKKVLSAVGWFSRKGIKLRVVDLEIARYGAYDYARRIYGYSMD